MDKKTADACQALNKEILTLFLRGLPQQISLDDLMIKWCGDWKDIKTPEFLEALEEVTRQTLKNNFDLQKISFYYQRILKPRLRHLLAARYKEINGSLPEYMLKNYQT